MRAFSCLLGLALLLPASLLAQRPERAPDTGTIRGVVIDVTRDEVIPGAMIVLDDLGQGTLSDSLGAFVLEDVPAGEELVTVRQYGYGEVGALVVVTPGEDVVLRVPLEPRPEMLDGITVIAERLATMERRLQSRRKATAVSTSAFQQERLLRTSALDVRDFLRLEAFLPLFPCGGSIWGECVWRRGRLVEPIVYIDEAPAIGGLEQLSMYQPHELYLLEVYSRGREIRAYTHQFMERMARRPIALIPINLP